jgi:hypothetical protein
VRKIYRGDCIVSLTPFTVPLVAVPWTFFGGIFEVLFYPYDINVQTNIMQTL